MLSPSSFLKHNMGTHPSNLYRLSNIEVWEMEEIIVVKVTSNDGTPLIYIPKAVREALKLYKGTYVKLKIENGKLILEPLKL